MKYLLLTLLLAISFSSTARDAKQVYAFHKLVPCPTTGKIQRTCKGYIVDHIVPLACGGVDNVSNMQYQTIADAKTKDKVERRGCKKR